jgi:hypothetical protein
MSSRAVAVRVLVVVVAVAPLWSLSLLLGEGSQEKGSVREAPPAGTERAVPGGAPAPVPAPPPPDPAPAPAPEPAPAPTPEEH